jgi:hypothetical protein
MDVGSLRLVPDFLSGAIGISFFRMRENMSPRFRLMLMALGG